MSVRGAAVTRSAETRRTTSATSTGKRVSALAIPAWLPLGGILLVSGAETVRVTGAHRELFFNIDHFWVLYMLLPFVIGIIIYGLVRRSRVWRLGRPIITGQLSRDSLGSAFDDLPVRLGRLVKGGGGTERVLRDPYSGVMHLCIMTSMIVLFLVTALLAIDDYIPVDILVGPRYLGYSLVADIFGLVGIIGVAMAVAHRWVRPRTAWLPTWEDWLILGGLGMLLITGFIVEGLRIHTSEIDVHPEWSYWSPVGYVVALIFSGVKVSAALDIHTTFWWIHMIGALSWITLLGYSKLNHLVLAPANAFLKRTSAPGKLDMIENIEEQEHFGVSQLEHFSMKQLFDLDVCVRCGRCTDNCPADIAGQPLSPMHIIQDLKSYATAVGERKVANLVQGNDLNFGLDDETPMVGGVVRDESLWACRTCGACVEACPVFIEHVPTIVDMRRSLVMEEARMPDTVQGTLETLERQGHPWRGTPYTRESWMEGIEDQVPDWTGEQDYLYFVGCTGAFVDRAQEITRSVVSLLRAADVSFGVIKGMESCNGDPARRLGHEYLYQILAEGLIELFNETGVNDEQKTVITHCPHCFNTFLNEYPDMGAKFQVIHHTQLLEQLVDAGRLVPSHDGPEQTITYHDSCYLGRHNDIFEAPRRILEQVPNVTLIEMPRNREQGLCCGAGGGNMWMEEQGKSRVNEVRVEEAVATGAESACTACPFCIQMFDSGIGTVQLDVEDEDKLKVLDVAELLQAAAVADGE